MDLDLDHCTSVISARLRIAALKRVPRWSAMASATAWWPDVISYGIGAYQTSHFSQGILRMSNALKLNQVLEPQNGDWSKHWHLGLLSNAQKISIHRDPQWHWHTCVLKPLPEIRKDRDSDVLDSNNTMLRIMSVLCCLDVASNLSRAKRHKMEIHMLPFTRHCFAEPSQTCPWAAHISPQRPAQTIVIRAPVGAPLRWLHYTLRFLEMRPQVGLNSHKTYLKTILYVYIYICVCVYHILYIIYIYILFFVIIYVDIFFAAS